MLVRRLHQENQLQFFRRARVPMHRAAPPPRRMPDTGRLGERSWETPSVERDFAALVMTHIAAGVLRYSDRQALLKAAARMGIGRFDANLLIAMTQHRCQQNVQSITLPRRRWHLLVAATILQTAILASFYWIMH